MGIEPTSSAWKAEVLPLNYTRPVSFASPFTAIHFVSPAGLRAPQVFCEVVEGVGFEPT